MVEYTSEGYDLDAIAASEGDNVVYELGGGATVIPNANKTTNSNVDTTATNDEGLGTAIIEAEEFKAEGNQFFKNGLYEKAYEMYSKAIDACPDVLSRDEILLQQSDFLESQRAEAISRQRLQHEKSSEEKKKETTEKEAPPKFELEPQPNGDKLAVFYCNRAAASIQMNQFEDAIKDCDVAILLDPKYIKGYVRRSSAYEKSENTESALDDAKMALSLDPKNMTMKKTVARLEKIEKERLEKLKAETMDKLKDLGNSLLGNFGLSLDNFNAVQDPKTGSYSISFNQNG